MAEEIHNNGIVTFHIRDGIVFGNYIVEKVELEDAVSATEFRKTITGNRAYPAYADLSGVKEVSREARSYFSKEAGEDLKAIALIIRNPVTRMMANFFMKFNQPHYPIRFFTSDQDAVKWLKQFVDEEALHNAK
jgi:hypothetical protein